jgi:hypothetical protein
MPLADLLVQRRWLSAAEHLRKEPNPGPLRQRDDFKALLRKNGEKAKPPPAGPGAK